MTSPVEHRQQIDALRSRQIALVRKLSSEDAIEVLAQQPIGGDEEQDIVANIIVRHMGIRYLEGK